MTNAELIAEIERRKCTIHKSRLECQRADCDNLYETSAFLIDNLPTILSALRGVEAAREGLERIERWELPSTGRFWENTDGTISDRPIGYEACYGSNGARDCMREVARKALAALSEVTP